MQFRVSTMKNVTTSTTQIPVVMCVDIIHRWCGQPVAQLHVPPVAVIVIFWSSVIIILVEMWKDRSRTRRVRRVHSAPVVQDGVETNCATENVKVQEMAAHALLAATTVPNWTSKLAAAHVLPDGMA